ncbi:MAG: tetratricopeptide repeat protein [Spirochaetaceae bacterium]|nr:tetratricopeptide repeat protein [Myxococcales bacterium]MCB9723393.1 tetratricopeptide repeat protein [Spirochaetaceae bacterium]
MRATLRVGGFASDRELLVQGRQAFERGDDAAALEHLARLADHGLPYADLYYMLGVLQERAGELDVALESLRRAVRINPAYVEALLALASLHERRGDFERSRGYAERASQLTRPVSGELDPTTRGKLANLQAALADALAAAGERRDAIEEYRRALDRCPTYHDIRHRLAVTLREAGLPFQAAQELRRILRLQPSMLMSQIQLGLTYYSMGRTPEAIAEWEAVLERDPSRDEARMYLRLVRGASRHAEIAATVEGLARTTTAGERVAEPSRAGWSTTALAGRSERGEGAVDATDGTIPDVADPPDASMRARPASEPVHG